MFSPVFQYLLGRETLIAPDDIWGLLAMLCAGVGAAVYLEQKYRWASAVSGVVLTMVAGILLSNLGFLPANSLFYDNVIWSYAVPMAIPLLLLQCNIRKIWTETGHILVLFLIGSAGTVCGAFLAFLLFRSAIPELPGVTAMMIGTYTGGSVNFSALAGEFSVSGNMVSSATVADNLLMALYFLLLIFCAGSRFFLRFFPHPHIEEACFSSGSGFREKEFFQKNKPVSVKNIAFNMMYCSVVVFASKGTASLLDQWIPDDSPVWQMIHAFVCSEYIWITTISLLFATAAAEQAEKMNGAREIGTWLIYLFLFVIVVPASILRVILEVPLLLLFSALIVLINMLFCFTGACLLHFSLEEAILASNANIGGPTTAAGMAVSQGWHRLTGPVVLVGTLGYAIGTYLGVISGNLLGA